VSRRRNGSTRRKVAEDLAIETLVAYVVLDAARRSMTVYRRDEGPQTFVRSGDGRGVRLSADLEVRFPLSIDDPRFRRLRC
jgi:hypothetical protein